MLCPSGKLGGLREPRGALTAAQKSAEGIAGRSGSRRPDGPRRGVEGEGK